MLDYALDLIKIGLPVFPLHPLSKFPALDGYPSKATTDPAVAARWWLRNPQYNVGISTDTLFAVDVDEKDGRHGGHTLRKLRADGFEFPASYEQLTPSGGFHAVYSIPPGTRLSNSVGERGRGLGLGIDTRGKGGYLVGRGSVLDSGAYAGALRLPVPAPAWMLKHFEYREVEEESGYEDPLRSDIDLEAAYERSFALVSTLPVASAGSRNDAVFKAACFCRDFGLRQEACRNLLVNGFRASPSLEDYEVTHAVRSAYTYAQKKAGSAAPEVAFKGLIQERPAPAVTVEEGDWVDGMNRKYAYCLMGNTGRVLWETTDELGRFELRSLTVDTLHDRMQGEVMHMDSGAKSAAISRMWMSSTRRRTYDGVVFAPEQQVNPRFYNLWRGFRFTPLPEEQEPTDAQKRGVNALLEHTYENFCQGKAELFRWLIGYFAHLVQRPWEKPLVALVIRGERGVGKDSLLDRMGALVGGHYLQCSRERYLHSQFNAHLENLLLFGLNEAVYAFDKKHKGVLNDLITGREHNIERKGQETYRVANLLRLVIIGNDDTLVPAAWDERRYACFDVGTGRKQDKGFFQGMRVDLEDGGYPYLLRYLLDFDISGLDFNQAPDSQLLHEQKIAALEPLHQWWHECLTEGRIVGAGFVSERWPEEGLVSKDGFRDAFRRWRKERGVPGRDPHEQTIGKRMREAAPGTNANAKIEARNAYRLPDLVSARQQWERFIGFREEWPTE